ncbi:MAG: archaellin/type IV pilin N-terminal domain-containing protein [Nanoarchaeota archaeon]
MLKKGGNIMYKFRKRGISPLIATVLIIGFTVALAAVIMTWGQGCSKSMQQSTEQTTNVQLTCANDVQFEVKNVCWEATPADCAVAGVACLKVTVANNGNKDLKSLTARIKETQEKIGVKQDLAALSAYGLNVYELDPTALAPPNLIAGASVTEVELIPVIDVNGKDVTCANSIAKFGDVVKAEVIAPCA